MNISARIATLHPSIVGSIWLLTVIGGVSPMLRPLLLLGWPIVWFVWMPCVYVAMRNANAPPPQKRFPVLAAVPFVMMIGGFLVGQLIDPLQAIAAPWLAIPMGASFALGLFASFWVTADALVKAETGRSALADPHEVRQASWCFLLPPIGAWFVHPRIKRVLETNAPAGALS